MTRRELDRALPQPMLDLIRDGVPRAELRAKGDQAVWTALVRTAASASQRRWECWEWETLLADPRSLLGAQARLRGGKKPRTRKQTAQLLDAAWDKGTEWVSEQPDAWDRDAAREQVRERAAGCLQLVENPDAQLLDPDRAVLAYAARQAVSRGTDRVPMPRRQVMAETGLGLTAFRYALRRLDAKGLLTVEDPGKPAGPSVREKDRRAALYRIAAPEVLAAADPRLYRETRSVVPPRQVCGAPQPTDDGAPRQVCGAPPLRPLVTLPPAARQETPPVVTLTLSATTPERLVEVLDLLNRQAGATVAPVGVPPAQDTTTAAPDNVRPLRRTGRVS